MAGIPDVLSLSDQAIASAVPREQLAQAVLAETAWLHVKARL